MKRIVGSIPHGEGYLRTTDIDCHAASQGLVIASHRRDLNGFHHALLDGSGLHLDQPAMGDLLSATRQIAIAPDGMGIVVSRQFEGFAEPRFGLVRGDLFTRRFGIFRAPTVDRSYISPDFSPSGRQLAYVVRRHHDDSGWSSRLIISNSAGRKESAAYETRRQISDVAWSPTGEWLALVVDGQVYRMHPFGGAVLTRLTDHLGGATSPRWSPDGAQISYVAPSTFRGQNQLFVMKADGSSKRRVANIHGDLVNGCWARVDTAPSV
jgi:WD40 repeat protein